MCFNYEVAAYLKCSERNNFSLMMLNEAINIYSERDSSRGNSVSWKRQVNVSRDASEQQSWIKVCDSHRAGSIFMLNVNAGMHRNAVRSTRNNNGIWSSL